MGYRYVCLYALISVFLGMSLAGCSTLSVFTKKRVEIRSQPTGAMVSTVTGETIGTTPVVLEETQLAKVIQGDRIALNISDPGYVSRQVVLDVKGVDTHTVTLEKMEKNTFSQTALNDYSGEINAMVREILRIQGLLLVRRTEEARKDLTVFQKQYPQVAAGYVMQANIAMMKGDTKKARRLLLRAKSLDSADPVIARMLKQVGGVGK